MKRIKLVISYDGTNYCGWQIQPNGRTIEEILNEKLSQLLKENIQVIGASRTDSGVHALGNVAVFDTNTKIPPEKICYALNQRLPEDIVIQQSMEVPLSYHPRKCNTIKTYEYKILNRKIPMPKYRLDSYFYFMPLDIEKMKEAGKYLVGEHDFRSFCSTRTQIEDTVRTIYGLDIKKEDDMIHITISGNGFLYNMVRIIVGTLIRVGTGFYTPEQVEEILDKRERSEAGQKVPAHGLTLVSIVEEEELENVIHVNNKYMEYTLIQKEIVPKKKAYIVLNRCVNSDYEATIVRLTKQATRNGAKDIYICDKTNGLVNGRKIGYYTYKEYNKLLKMEYDLQNYWEVKNNIEDSLITFAHVENEMIEQYVDIYNKCFFEVPMSSTWNTEEMKELIQKKENHFYFIQSNGETVGIFFWSSEKEAMIEAIGVLPQFRGKKIGKKAIQLFLKQLKENNRNNVYLTVSDNNVSAKKCYESLGFREIEVQNIWFHTYDEKLYGNN